MKIIKLGKDKAQEAIVCDCHFEKVAKYNWHVKNGYARRNLWVNGKSKTILMHREICLFIQDGLIVDHKNRNKLDNRCSNLRAVSHRVNCNNIGANTVSNTGFRGVYKNTGAKTFRAMLSRTYLGSYNSAEEASKVQEKAAIAAGKIL